MTVARKRKPYSRASKPKTDKVSAAKTGSAKSAGWAGEERRSEGRFEALLFDISKRFVALPADLVDGEIVRAQREVCECLDLEISSVWQMHPNDPGTLLSTQVYVPPDYDVPVLEMSAQDFFPWSMTRLVRGEIVALSRMTDIPPEGASDLEIFRYYRIQSSICFPLSVGGGQIFGAVAFDTCRKQTIWTADLIYKLGLVAQIFSNAIFRKRTDHELRENEARYRDLFEDSLEGIFRTSSEGRIVFINPALATMLGYDSPTEVLRSVTDLAGQVWADPEERSRFIQRLEKEGAVRAYECRLKRKDGTPIWVSITVQPVRGPDGRIVHFDGFADNIEQRKSMELDLADSVSRYQALFEIAPVGLCVVRPDGRVRMANVLQARLYGYDSPLELDGFFAPAFIVERDRERATRDWQVLLEGQALLERVYMAVRRDGSEFPAEVTALVLRGPGQAVLEYLFLTRDITRSLQDERERTELRLERTHLARVLTVDELSTSLAHEINQPLGAILNNAEAAGVLLAQGPGRAGQVPEIIGDIIHDARRAGEIINKVRRVLKKSDAAFERLAVNGLVEESLEIVRNNLALTDVKLRLELAPALEDITGDRVRLQQVLLNLITNALDAMKGRPTRILTLRTAMDEPDLVTVSVGDTGHGVAERDRESVFEPFFTTKKQGLGLGLPICRSIIEEHKGRIWLANGPGGGTVFSFFLNARRGQDA